MMFGNSGIGANLSAIPTKKINYGSGGDGNGGLGANGAVMVQIQN